MSTNVNLGIVSVVPKGEWNASASYQKLNVVRHNGSSYMAIVPSTNIEPGVSVSSSSYWMLLNEDGSTGEQGPQGDTGEGVPTGGTTGQVLAKNSDTNYDSKWIPQNQIAAGSADNDGQGNNIFLTYEKKENAQQTYETKTDAQTKNTNLQNQITANTTAISTNTQNISTNTNNIARNTTAISTNSQLISRNAKRLDGLEQRINPSPFVTDDTVAYQKDVPEGAVSYAEVNRVGGMSYKTVNLIPYPYVYTTRTISGVTFTVNEDRSVTVNGTASANASFYLISDAKFSTGQYSISGIPANKGGSGKFLMTLRVNNDNAGVDIGAGALGNVNDSDVVSLFIRVYEGVTVNNATVYPMLNAGSTALPYEPYFEGLRDSKVTEITSIGANLLPYPYAETNKTVNGVTFTVNEDGSVTINGTPTADTGLALSTDSTKFTLRAGTYMLSRTTSVPTNAYWYINTDKGSITTNIGTVTFDIDVTVKLAALIALGGTTYNSVTVYPMLNKGSTALPYSPYQEHTLPIPEAVQALDGYGWGMNESVYNYIDWEKKQFVKRVEKLTLNGSGTTWTVYGNSTLYNASLMNNAKKRNNSAVYALCNAIPYTENAEYLNSYYIVRVSNDNGLQFNNVLELYGLSENSSAAFNAYLAEHPMTFVYELETPIVTDISNLITADNLISIQGYGTLTFENEYNFAVPSTEEYITAESAT